MWLWRDSPLGQIQRIFARNKHSLENTMRHQLFHFGKRLPVMWWNETFKNINTVECDFKKFLASITMPLLWAGFFFPLWREQKKRSEACLAEEAPEGGGNCHFYLQPSQTPPGLLSRWPLLKLSEALTPFSQLRVSIDTGWLWFSHIDFVSHVLLTVKTDWVDAGTWMPWGIKH